MILIIYVLSISNNKIMNCRVEENFFTLLITLLHLFKLHLFKQRSFHTSILEILYFIIILLLYYFFCRRPRHEKSSKTKYINALQKHLVAMTRRQRKIIKVIKVSQHLKIFKMTTFTCSNRLPFSRNKQ